MHEMLLPSWRQHQCTRPYPVVCIMISMSRRVSCLKKKSTRPCRKPFRIVLFTFSPKTLRSVWQKQMMKALSGKYTSVSPKGNRQRGSGGGGEIGNVTRRNRPSGGSTTLEDDKSRRASFPPEHMSSEPLQRPSASIGTAS